MLRKSEIFKKVFNLFWVVLFLMVGSVWLWAGGRKMKLYSPAFADKGRIPLKYVMPAAGGQNISPPLKWEGVPEGTKSLVLVCVDIHPIARNWIHWIVINIPPETTKFKEGASLKEIKSPILELENTYGFKGWGGPQPPPGTGEHPYVFKLFALKVSEIKLSSRPSYEEILRAIKPHLIAETEFTGYFGR
ncbi:MAG: YbhB/YbcL family Raf kinase inhibitor-like protein [Caldimicrobium sp.]